MRRSARHSSTTLRMAARREPTPPAAAPEFTDSTSRELDVSIPGPPAAPPPVGPPERFGDRFVAREPGEHQVAMVAQAIKDAPTLCHVTEYGMCGGWAACTNGSHQPDFTAMARAAIAAVEARRPSAAPPGEKQGRCSLCGWSGAPYRIVCQRCLEFAAQAKWEAKADEAAPPGDEPHTKFVGCLHAPRDTTWAWCWPCAEEVASRGHNYTMAAPPGEPSEERMAFRCDEQAQILLVVRDEIQRKLDSLVRERDYWLADVAKEKSAAPPRPDGR